MANVGRKKIKESLIKQLQSQGTDTPFYLDMVEKYLDLWDDIAKMRKDLKTRGRTYQTQSATGYPITKENENVKLIPNYIKQMQAMLDSMGIKPANITPDGKNCDEL